MEESAFDSKKSALDAELDSLESGAQVGILLGGSLYGEFRRRGLLEPKLADMMLWKWTAPSYRGKFVCDEFEIAGDDYRIGTAKAAGT